MPFGAVNAQTTAGRFRAVFVLLKGVYNRVVWQDSKSKSLREELRKSWLLVSRYVRGAGIFRGVQVWCESTLWIN